MGRYDTMAMSHFTCDCCGSRETKRYGTGRPDGWVPVEIGASKPVLCCPPCLNLARTVLKAFFTYGRLIRAQDDAAGDENSAKESEGGT